MLTDGVELLLDAAIERFEPESAGLDHAPPAEREAVGDGTNREGDSSGVPLLSFTRDCLEPEPQAPTKLEAADLDLHVLGGNGHAIVGAERHLTKVVATHRADTHDVVEEV